MANLSDMIEDFIKEMFDDMPEGILEIQRNEMANQFQCAPSQINYVLTTRFTLERGYFVESRRGGGGYIRIKKLKIREDEFLRDVIECIGDSISGSDAKAIIERLWEEDVITDREKEILCATVSKCNLPLSSSDRNLIRARIMKAVITTIMDFEARKGGEE
ncbi:Transcriptional regulator CtsR [Tepidanaerobacter acetatoxydans Re1]|uniref:Transcriptional regulator CtsR n=1 Tax=Tepidanaerobacter acetatoxydans (strain DSM 21804 / JCM 16047 / Re1) TaxID=1209989 RepID=F4LRW6_TEPAE|nr:CtsR family transcriptional regulator [Tepidanaerobacter acetatoxydans]AEE92305.1 transcriptional repressor, CtsR [Tepidanaerobacter acetatoxydans Re1]CCP27186.1 Transcriptional regulator CtsR [Tepidanaerobacter acetatoxydans Re1]